MENEIKKMTPIEKAWDFNCRCVPEDGYKPIEEELSWVIGKDIMLKSDFVKCVKNLLRDLYKEVKHGDKEHRQWLKQKFDEFAKVNSKLAKLINPLPNGR